MLLGVAILELLLRVAELSSTQSGTKTNSATTVNVTTNDAANDALAFSTIDHLITAQTSPAGSNSETAPTQPASASPVFISTGSNSVPFESGSSSSSLDSGNLANLAIIVGGVLALIAFIHSRGKTA